MSGIDRSDQMLSYHSSLRKTRLEKVVVHLVELLLVNAHYLYSRYSKNIFDEIEGAVCDKDGREAKGEESDQIES